MFARKLRKPSQSFFLFGPRGTGKSTWIRHHFKNVPFYDLLDTGEVIRLSRAPNLLFHELRAYPMNSWVVIDEVQKVPALLNEVHRLIEQCHIRFVLSGSSARQLKRNNTNLLAGRAVTVNFFPLVSAEMRFSIKLPDFFTTGTMPLVVTGHDPIAYLSSYVETYLETEIKAEALTRNLGGFARFLEIAARQNGQVTNVSGIARDASVSRQTAQNYFDILVDTLVGYWIHPWKLKRATKQVAHPKFYFFDSGVVRALAGRLPYPPSQEELGPLVETALLNEIRAFIAYSNLHYPLHYWCSYDGVEVDVLCETHDGFIAIEIKAASAWDKRFNRGLSRMRNELASRNVTCFGVYQGVREARFGDTHVLPVRTFLERLWNGEIIG